MLDPSDELLWDYATGSLEPGETLRVGEAVAGSPALQRRLLTIRAALQAPRARPWFLPALGPLGPAAPTLALGRPHVFGDARPLGSGELFRIEVRVDDADRVPRRLLLLRRGAQGWAVVFPVTADEDVAVADIPTQPDGSRHVLARAGSEPGPQRWAVALPSAEISIDWEADVEERWTWLREDLARGLIPCTTVVVEVTSG